MAILSLCLAVVFCGQVLYAASVIEKPVFVSTDHANSFLRKKRASFLCGTSQVEETRDENLERAEEDIERIENGIEWTKEVREVNLWLREADREYPSMDAEEADELVEETREILGHDLMNQVIVRVPRKANILAQVASAFVDGVTEFLGTTTDTAVLGTLTDTETDIAKVQCLSDKLLKEIEEINEKNKDITDDILNPDDPIIMELHESCVNIVRSCSCITKNLPTTSIKTEGQLLKTVWRAFCPVIQYNCADVAGTGSLLETFNSGLVNYCGDSGAVLCAGDDAQKMIDETKKESEKTKLLKEANEIYKEITKLINSKVKYTIEDYKKIIELFESLKEKDEKLKDVIVKEIETLEDGVEKKRAENLLEVVKQSIDINERGLDDIKLDLLGKLADKARAEGNVADEKAAAKKMIEVLKRQKDRATADKDEDKAKDLQDQIDAIYRKYYKRA